MDFWARLIGSAYAPRKPAPKPAANDPQARLARFRRVYNTVLELCNRPRNPANEAPLLDNLRACLDRIAVLIREETRAPVPHTCLQFARSSQIYAVIARAATVSQYEPIIRASVAVLAALVDSEEEDFLSSAPFAKSLMRLVTRVVDSGNVLISVETETAILELLFTIAAKIRLQPEILPVWFQSTARPELEDVYVHEKKKSFVGITQKDDFPLCYLLIDRVHHEGRIGDFARTGLLYIFEATGRSEDLERWVVSSDLPTLMASGLGALYSQLSRELSILHPDATLPAVLAMSDYSTTHPRATAESAFSDRHQTHMATFLSYLAFWQDVLDHCRSSDVKQTLLDHFQILFLQQLLYPSLLQSSDTDAGSSVAVLTYMTAMLESLDYPDLMNMMLIYLLAIQDQRELKLGSGNGAFLTSNDPPRSGSTVKRRQSLMLLNAPKNPDDAVEPTLFNLVDLIINNVNSKNSQTVYAALRLTSTIIVRQKRYAFGTLLKVEQVTATESIRTIGALEVELEQYYHLAVALHRQHGLDETYARLCEDVRFAIESQAPSRAPEPSTNDPSTLSVGTYRLLDDDIFVRTIFNLLRTFFTNTVDVNLALTHTIISIALSADVRLDEWALINASTYHWPKATVSTSSRPWQASLDDDEKQSWTAVQKACQRPAWRPEHAPILFRILQTLIDDLDLVRRKVTNLDQLITGRKNMLQATNLDGPLSEPPSLMHSPARPDFLDVPRASSEHERPQTSPSSSTPASVDASAASRDKKANDIAASSPSSPRSRARSLATSTQVAEHDRATRSPVRDLFRPPPPETPSTTDVLMQTITFDQRRHVSHESTGEAAIEVENISAGEQQQQSPSTATAPPSASLNHVLTNIVVLQEFILELVAVMHIRGAVLGDQEVLCNIVATPSPTSAASH